MIFFVPLWQVLHGLFQQRAVVFAPSGERSNSRTFLDIPAAMLARADEVIGVEAELSTHTPARPTAVGLTDEHLGPRSGAEPAERSVSGTVAEWIARRTVGLCFRWAEGSTSNDRQRFASEND